MKTTPEVKATQKANQEYLDALRQYQRTVDAAQPGSQYADDFRQALPNLRTVARQAWDRLVKASEPLTPIERTAYAWALSSDAHTIALVEK